MVDPVSASQTRAVRSQEAVTAWVPLFSHSAVVTTLLWPASVRWGVLTTTAAATLRGKCECECTSAGRERGINLAVVYTHGGARGETMNQKKDAGERKTTGVHITAAFPQQICGISHM